MKCLKNRIVHAFFAGALLALSALALSGAEPPGSAASRPVTVEPDGRFVPPGRGFAVEFRWPEAQVKAGAAAGILKLPGQLVPAVGWELPHQVSARLELCQVRRAVGLFDIVLIAARVQMKNAANTPETTTLALAISPLVNAEHPLQALAFDRHAFFVSGQPVLVADTPARGAILAESAFAPRPLSPQTVAHVESADGQCRGEMIFDLNLKAGQTQTLGFICPITGDLSLDECRLLSIDDLFAEAEKQATGH